VQVRERQRVSVAALLGVLAVAALAVVVLMGYAQLTEMSSATVNLQAELKQLNTENVSLTAQYEKMYDLSTVKARAAAEGMSKPTSSQIYYVDLSGGDTAEVFEKKDPGIVRRLASYLHNGFYAVVEYLGLSRAIR
jgi:cell division protein FtsB